MASEEIPSLWRRALLSTKAEGEGKGMISGARLSAAGEKTTTTHRVAGHGMGYLLGRLGHARTWARALG